MLERFRSVKRWLILAPIIIFLIALLVVSMRSHVVSAKIAQFNSFSVGEKTSFIIALVAVYGLWISLWQTGYSMVANRRNNEEAKAQREQSALESKRSYDLMVVQMKRDSRIKLYAPLLAWLRGGWYAFDEEVKSLFPQLIGAQRMPRTHAENLDALQRRVLTFEFEAELDLLGTEAIQKAVATWRSEYHVAENLLRMLSEQVRPTDDEEAIVNFDLNFVGTKSSLMVHSVDLWLGLENLKQLILREIEEPVLTIGERRGMVGAQENENE